MMDPTDKQLMLGLLEAAEDYLTALFPPRDPPALYAQRKAARERIVDAIAEVAKRAQENGR